uniref:Homeobox-leucine zipper protein ROC3 n=2 Tax=Oryza TaxID=4527 RepID=ROC3_ORYSI|nr:RecName: Full=Homeobox-leucine zipper protein ROC3; AltName: Full=GLABR 2-like homeobox protein 3; AltName: Full=HD-ZIP protein ROC3; AltName: Full=Homeodomain transcription factor ROC3; AltName: Full=Protein RICE OUTERMOST CELL-SPECIFIC 3 [Oryza sativa Indica Group]
MRRMFGDCQVLSSMAAMAGASSSADALFASPLIPNPALAGFMSSSAAMPFHHFSNAAATLIPKEEGLMGGLHVAKDEEMDLEMDMELSGGSGSAHLDGLLSFADVDDDHKPQHSGHDQPPDAAQPSGAAGGNAKKKRYHRHTAHQIQQMEALFKECPHPDDKQRLKLSQELGLKPRQVKFWFQNRRTQMKAQQDRADNVILRAENENLKSDNFRLQAAIRNVVCPNCGHAAVLADMSYEEQQLRIENARLKDELDRLACIATRYGGGGGRQPVLSTSALSCISAPPPVLMPPLDLDMNVYSRHFAEQAPVMGCGDLIPPPVVPQHDGAAAYMGAMMAPVQEQDKQLVVDLAATAADQLARMCRAGEPLWVRQRGAEVMAVEEHARMFSWPVDGAKQGDGGAVARAEGTRDNAVVIMNSINLVDAFLDANKWMELFPSIVCKARTIQIINHGAASGHLGSGTLLLMQAEVQFLSPLVAAREVVFFRYCVHNADEGSWAIVDFPAEGFEEGLLQASVVRCRRRPSGCIIQDMPNGYSRVVWVEHMEMVGEEKPLQPVFRDYVASGAAFGATRWLSILQRQCERLASELARNIADLGVIRTPEARTNMMKLSQRMITTFCANISASGTQSWTALSDSTQDTIRVTTRKNTEPGQPSGVILTAVSTSWLPFTHQQVFELLADEQQRCQLEILSNGGSLHEVAHIANGSHPRNCISLLRINAASNSSQNVELLLQESSTHPDGGSLVVFATVDVDAIQVTMSGEDPSYIPLLPLGFAIFPATSPSPAAAPTISSSTTTTTGNGNGETSSTPPRNSSSNNNNADELLPPNGCLLTVGMQVLASAVPSAKLNLSSVTAINSHVCNAIHQITAALKGSAGGAGGEPASDQ